MDEFSATSRFEESLFFFAHGSTGMQKIDPERNDHMRCG
jgi:hypothetical protein